MSKSKSKKKKKKVDKVSVRKQIRKDYVVKKREESYHPYTLLQALKLLPDVGDRLMKAPTEKLQALGSRVRSLR